MKYSGVSWIMIIDYNYSVFLVENLDLILTHCVLIVTPKPTRTLIIIAKTALVLPGSM
tara:strand:+ start:286 stop:459 length:174 start_codon:yes stop_codon:yes gene_type:complete